MVEMGKSGARPGAVRMGDTGRSSSRPAWGHAVGRGPPGGRVAAATILSCTAPAALSVSIRWSWRGMLKHQWPAASSAAVSTSCGGESKAIQER